MIRFRPDPKPDKVIKTVKGLNKALKKESLGALKKKLDEVFSLYIRQRYATESGLVVCYTCQVVLTWKQSDCGHFQSRRHLATRWDERNCQTQCKRCNIFQQGQQFTFAKNLDNEFGPGEAEKLRIKALNKCKLSIFELRVLIKIYTEKLKGL